MNARPRHARLGPRADGATGFSWVQVAQGLVLTLIVAVPTLAVAEGLDRRYQPVIDRGGAGWVGFGLIVVLAFLAGGAVAGRRHATCSMASAEGATQGALGAVVLVGADLLRRAVLGEAEGSTTVLFYWFLGTLICLTTSIAGALLWHGATARRRHAPRT